MGHTQKAVIRRRAAAWTLVELLVVIAILAILFALLFPVAKTALASARSAACLNNLHQLSTAVANYVGDNNNYIPPIQIDKRDPDTGKSVTSKWWIELDPYIPYRRKDQASADFSRESRPQGENAFYVCPANTLKGTRISPAAFVNYIGVIDASGGTYVPNLGEQRRKISSFHAPLSSLPYLMDGFGTYPDTYVNCIINHYTGIVAAQKLVDQKTPENGVFKPVHGNNINLLYLDGHAASIGICDFANTTYDYSHP